MEEKKITKISLSTFLLLIAILVIVVMGVFICKLNQDKVAEIQKSTKLQAKVDSLNNTVSSLQSKVNSYTEVEILNNNQTNISVTNIFSNDEIKNAIQNYLDIISEYEQSPEHLLVKLGMTNFGENTETSDGGFVKTNIKYADYNKIMLNYMSSQLFEDNFTDLYKNVGGYVYFLSGGAGERKLYVEGVLLKGDYSNLNYIAKVYYLESNNTKKEQNIEFHIENYNDQCVISYCDFKPFSKFE